MHRDGLAQPCQMAGLLISLISIYLKVGVAGAPLIAPGGVSTAELWWARATGYVCTAAGACPGGQAANFLRPETVVNDNDVQPATSCGVVLPVSQAEGWLWLRRTAPDEVAFAVHARNWPNTALRSVHIHPGGPGVVYSQDDLGPRAGPIVAFVGGMHASALQGPNWMVVSNGSFSSGDLTGLLANQPLDAFFDMLHGRTNHTFIGTNLTVPIQGAYIAFHSALHPKEGQLRGDLVPATFSGVPTKI